MGSPQRESIRTRWPWIAAPVIFLALQIHWFWWQPGNDASAYLSIARHFARGEVQGFGTPFLEYAPGYPFLIAPLFWISDRPFLALSVVHFGLSLALMAGSYLWLRRMAPEAALPLTALVMLNVGLWNVYREVLSDLTFATIVVWAAWFLDRLLRCRGAGETLRWAAVAIPLLILATLTRHAGVLLAAGFGVAMGLSAWRGEQSWRRAVAVTLIVGVPAAGAVLGLIKWNKAMALRACPETRTYDECFTDESTSLPWQCAEGLRRELSHCGQLLVPGMYKCFCTKGQWLHVNNLIYGILAIPLIAGWWALARRTGDPLLWTLPFYLALHCYWPIDQGTRYMVPVLAVLWASLWYVLQRRVPPRFALLVGLALLHGGVSLAYWTRDVGGWARMHRDWPHLEQLVDAAGSEVEALAVAGVDFEHWRMLAVESNRRLPSFRPSQPIAASVRLLIVPQEQSSPAGFSEVAASGTWRLLRRTAAAQQAATPAALNR